MVLAFAQKYGLRAISVGTSGTSRINPMVIDAMKEKGIDVSGKPLRTPTPELVERATLVITLGCSATQVFPKLMLTQMQKKLVDWELMDPKGKSLPVVREIRDEIEKRVIELSKQA